MPAAGGVLQDALFPGQSARGFRATAAPKGVAVANCLRAQALQPAAVQVLFSSVSSLLGSPGQANYAAANAVLDAAAAACAQRGSPVLSVQWGAWAGGGMAAQDKQTAARVERTGMALIQPERGLAALSGVLGAAGGWSGRRASRRVVGDEGMWVGGWVMRAGGWVVWSWGQSSPLASTIAITFSHHLSLPP